MDSEVLCLITVGHTVLGNELEKSDTDHPDWTGNSPVGFNQCFHHVIFLLTNLLEKKPQGPTSGKIHFLLPSTLSNKGNSFIILESAGFVYSSAAFRNCPSRTRGAKPRTIHLEPANGLMRALSSKINVNLISLSKRPTTFTSSLHLAESPRTTLRMDVSRSAPGVAGSAAALEFQILILIGCIPGIVHA